MFHVVLIFISSGFIYGLLLLLWQTSGELFSIYNKQHEVTNKCVRKNQYNSRKMHEEKNKTKNASKPADGLNVPGSNWEKFKNIVNKPCEKDKSLKSKVPNPKLRNPKPPKRKFDDVMKFTNKSEMNANGDKKRNHQVTENNTTVTKHIAMDCEMVGIGNGTDSMIARVSIVNRFGVCIYDKYVKPTEKIQDYRTAVSGIRPRDLENAEDFRTVQNEVAKILQGRILVGHALKNDLDVLFLSHPKRSIRDTSRYKPFRKVSKGNTPSLKKLAAELLGIDIQRGEHNSIEDAKAAMQLYVLYKSKWESSLHSK